MESLRKDQDIIRKYRNLTGMTRRHVTWDKHARMHTHFFSRGSSGHGNIATATGGGRCDKALSKQGIVEQSDVKKTKEEKEAMRFLFMVIHCQALKLISF